ncbi:hypothetical protein E2C01_015347 [Portunus trituberculatus]|uniref:C-type lectin domain-containing protein n=1 Tax=Portunus trituberculatus TaxID=210409 RepID=A0A5B7DMB7_PORTR|nr:hypothetical protein [Portunus trituberculatus]
MKWLLLFVATAVLFACCQGCSQGYEQVGDNCLAFHLGSAYNWTEADDVCSKMYGGILASVKSASDLRAIYEYINTYGLTDSFWLGGSDLAAEGDWVWLADGSRVSKATPFWALANGLFGDHDVLAAMLERRKHPYSAPRPTDALLQRSMGLH